MLMMSAWVVHIPCGRCGRTLSVLFLSSFAERSAESAMEFFRLPTNRVVELGSQVEI